MFEEQIKDQDFDYVKNLTAKKKVISSSSKEFINLKNEFQHHMNSLNNQIERMTNSYNQEKTKFTLQMLEHKKNKKDLEKEIKNLKTLYNSLAQEQRVYYVDIVKRGIDVRYEGLSWAIKRLIELNAHLDYSIFPRFLDHSQVDYLLKVNRK
jgi:N12 class adenine-specific DNA methylase